MATSKTKAKLEEENRLLRSKVEDLAEKLKTVHTKNTDELGESPELALGLYKKDNQYFFAKILFDPDTETSKVTELHHASKIPGAAHLAQHNAEKYLVDVIFSHIERNND
jgi:hypothetical protein